MLAKEIRDRERGGRVEIGVIEGDAEGNMASLMESLCEVIGERPASLPDGTPDEQVDQEQLSQVSLYQWVQNIQRNPVKCFKTRVYMDVQIYMDNIIKRLTVQTCFICVRIMFLSLQYFWRWWKDDHHWNRDSTPRAESVE